MKRIMSSVIMGLALVGAMATSALAISFNGASVSVNSAQFNFGGGIGNNLFTTAVGSNDVAVEFQNSASVTVLTDSTASLVFTAPVSFTGGFSNGSGGSFSIFDGINGTGSLLLSGTFGTTVGDAALGTIPSFRSQEFFAAIITAFTGGTFMSSFGAPGEFSATLGNVATPLALGGNWTTGSNVGAHIQSHQVPEPTSLLLLGAGLAFVGGWQWMKRKGMQA